MDSQANRPLNIDDEQVEKLVNDLCKKPIIKGALTKLSKELPDNLYYHTYEHTEDVLREVILFSLIDDLPESAIELLAIAAVYHDTGFIFSQIDNEEIGAKIATEAMREEGKYSDEDIACVEQMILDTRLIMTDDGPKQIPNSELSKYLLDADLSNLGRKDFFDKGELQRQEIGEDKKTFLKKTYKLLRNHAWLTDAAKDLRQRTKEKNLEELKKNFERIGEKKVSMEENPKQNERLNFLCRLPLLLNSSLERRRVIEVAIEHLKKQLDAGAATVFLLSPDGSELTFWALQGGSKEGLEGSKMPSGKGLVGWVVENQQALLVNDAQNDERFFKDVDKENKFITRNVLCVPMIVRGSTTIGAIQVLNKNNDQDFTQEELEFLDQCASQIALAIDNARLFEAAKNQNIMLRKLDRRKREMMSVITHEFRTPLSIIQGTSDLLGSGALNKNPDAAKEMADTLHKGVNRLTKLVSQINDLAKISKQKGTVNKSNFNISDMFASLEEHYKPVAAQREIELSFSVAEGTSTAFADRSLIIVVMKNLISNAIRFTDNGGKVEVSAKQKSGLVTFEVKDSGIGIPPTEQQVIFEKFYEVADALKHSSGEHEFKSGGLGLGLATVREILTDHNSTIELESKEAVGSSFKFSLPVAGN